MARSGYKILDSDMHVYLLVWCLINSLNKYLA